MIMEEPHGLCHISEVLEWIIKNTEAKKIIYRGEIIGMMLAISKLMLTFVVLINHQGEVAR